MALATPLDRLFDLLYVPLIQWLDLKLVTMI
jgi:hypothetical protein